MIREEKESERKIWKKKEKDDQRSRGKERGEGRVIFG